MNEPIEIAEAGEFSGRALVVRADDFERVRIERDALFTKIKELEKQEPVAWIPDDAIIKLRSGWSI